MFKELPAWGIYIRHVKGVIVENLTLTCEKKDYRTAIVLDDVTGAIFKSLKVNDRGNKKDLVYSYKSTGVIFNK